MFRTLIDSLAGMDRDYTTGSINRAIVLLSIPMVLEMGAEALFAVVDIYWVNRISTDAVAIVGLTESMMTIVYSISIGLSMGATAMVARRIGEKKPQEAANAAAQAIIIAVAISAMISLVGILYPKSLLQLMGASATVIEQNYGYTQIIMGSNVVIMLLFLYNAIFRGAGNAMNAMLSLGLANVLNMVLDPILIFGLGPIPAMGLEGAAIATSIGRGTAVLFQTYLLTSKKGLIHLTARHLKVQWPVMATLIKVSLGGMAQFLIGSASWVFLVRIISEFGAQALAGYTIAIRIIIFSILPSWGMSNAAATLVGQNLGAQLPERAEKSVWRCGFLKGN